MDTGGGFLFIIVLASSISVLFAESPSVTRKKRHLLPLIGFLQGYKMGQNLALQLPPLVLSPVVVFPFNQEQSVHFHATNDEDNIDNGFKVTISEKFIRHCNSSDTEVHKMSGDENLTIGNNVEFLNEAGTEEDTFRQSITNDTVDEANDREDNVTTVTDVNQTTAATVMKTERDENATKSFGPYPTAVYKNDKIATLTITETPNDSGFMLPSTDDNWQNFTSKVITTESQVESRTGQVWSDDITYSKPDHSRDPTPYANYYGVKAHAPTGRWSTFYTGDDNKLTSEFRPLAGLYYDGFLHKAPVQNQGFVPYGNKYII